MKTRLTISLTLLLSAAGLLNAQVGRTLDWPTTGGDVQRSGWEKSDTRFTPANVGKSFQLLWKMQQQGASRLMPPVIIGTFIGYRGFKELAMFGGSNDSLYAIDSDMDRMYWETKFIPPAHVPQPTEECPGGMTATPTLMTFGFRRSSRRAHVTGRPAGNPMYGPRAIYAISSDGMLRRVNVANGGEAGMAFQVVPANAQVSTLNMDDSVIYATTSNGCGAVGNGVWAIDLSNPDASAAPPVQTLMTHGGNFLGIGGPVIAKDGMVYVQTGDGELDPAHGKYSNTLLALNPGDLEVKGYFIDPAASTAPAPKGDLNSVTPVSFATADDHEMIVSAGRDGHLYLLNPESFKGDHKTPLAVSAKVSPDSGGLWGGLATWADSDDKRYVLATVWDDSRGASGSVTAFRLDYLDSKPVFKELWSAKNLVKPVPPVISSGVAFILSSGDRDRNAMLHAVDALTGAELWSTQDQVTSRGNLTPLTVANGRVYFVTADSTVWVFGVPLEL